MYKGNNSSNSKRLAVSGILLALTAVTLFVASIMPTSKLSLYALSSFFVSIIIMEFGIKAGWAFYVASCLLAFIAVRGSYTALIPFVLFFGVYGIIKHYIEKIRKLVIELFLKIVFFNITLAAGIIFVREFFFDPFKSRFPFWAVIIGLEIAFVVYDYVYSLFVQYYIDKIKKKLKI